MRQKNNNLERFSNWTYPTFDKNGMTKWHWKCDHHQNLKLGNKVDIGSFTYINAVNGVTIGKNSQIGSHCSLYSLSTIDNKNGPIEIGENVKIGSHSTIMPGVQIGNNAVIGAHSFVNKNIGKNVVAFGVPAKAIKKV